jgi:hypothetical protein
MIVIDLNGDGNLTDEFNAGNLGEFIKYFSFACNSIYYKCSLFQTENTLTSPLIIPAGTTSGEKLMRVIHMFRSPNECSV